MRVAKVLSVFWRDERGAAAVEMALVTSIVSGALINVAEVGRYLYTTAQVTAATQAGAQAAAARCDLDMIPVTVNCAVLNTSVTAAVQGGSLGDRLTLNGALHERWYCVTATRTLQDVAPAGSPIGNCSNANLPSGAPSLYLRVRTQFVYAPMFPGLTVVDSFPATIVRTAWMRMN